MSDCVLCDVLSKCPNCGNMLGAVSTNTSNTKHKHRCSQYREELVKDKIRIVNRKFGCGYESEELEGTF